MEVALEWVQQNDVRPNELVCEIWPTSMQKLIRAVLACSLIYYCRSKYFKVVLKCVFSIALANPKGLICS